MKSVKRLCEEHRRSVKAAIRKRKHYSQIDSIDGLNPIVMEWYNYFNFSNV